MEKIMNGNAVSLIIVKLVLYSLILIGFIFYLHDEAKDVYNSTIIPTRAEYINEYDNHVRALEYQKTKAEEDMNAFSDPIVLPILFIIFFSGYLVYQCIQLLLSVFVVDRIRKNNEESNLEFRESYE